MWLQLTFFSISFWGTCQGLSFMEIDIIKHKHKIIFEYPIKDIHISFAWIAFIRFFSLCFVIPNGTSENEKRISTQKKLKIERKIFFQHFSVGHIKCVIFQHGKKATEKHLHGIDMEFYYFYQFYFSSTFLHFEW